MAHARRRWTKPLLFLLAGAAIALPSAASAQQWRPNPAAAGTPSKAQVEEAKARFKQGLRLYQDEGQIEAALVELERAYDLAPNYRVLYNIGQVARSLPDYVTSLRAFERYLRDGGHDISDARRDEVEKELDYLRSRVATISISTNTDGATVSIDDVPVGTTPLAEPLLVNAGRRRIGVTKDGLAASKTVTVAGRDSLKLDLPIDPERTAPAAPAPGSEEVPKENPSVSTPPSTSPPAKAPAPRPAEPAKSSIPWIGWGVTGALAAGTVVTGILALSASSDVEDGRYVGTEIPSDISDAQSRTETLAVVTDVLAGATAVAFGVTLTLTLMDSGGNDEPAARPGAAREGTPALRLGVGPGTLQLGGMF